MKRKILLVYPEIPATYWSFKHVMPFVGYKSLMPPLGLITVAAMLPDDFDLRLIDMNIQELANGDILAADLVFVSAMIVQKESFHRVVRMCNRCGVPVVAGGPYPTTSHESIRGVDHFVLNEGEITLPRFIADLDAGRPQKVYCDETRPDITKTPPPRFDLLDLTAYGSMALQSSRGCPFNCEFCDIIEMFGRVPRYKLPGQFVAEMDLLHRSGYRGPLFIVDDNFIGNKRKVRELLDRIIEWQEAHDYPFSLYTEASINLAQDDDLLEKMAAAGLDMVFIGIETPVQETLQRTNKMQNTRNDIIDSITRIQEKGIEVMGGFIIGFDTDPENIFDLQIDFIQKAGIPLAMIGTLIALPGTQLYRRLEREGRITGETDGNNTHSMEMNFTPVMDRQALISGYKRVIASIYEPRNYFARCETLIRRMPRKLRVSTSFRLGYMMAFIRSLALQTFSRYGLRYWKLLVTTLVRNPARFSMAVNLAIKGYHFFRITSDILRAERVSEFMQQTLARLESRYERAYSATGNVHPALIERYAERAKHRVRRTYRRLNPDLKAHLRDPYIEFKLKCETMAYRWSRKALHGEDIIMAGS